MMRVALILLALTLPARADAWDDFSSWAWPAAAAAQSVQAAAPVNVETTANSPIIAKPRDLTLPDPALTPGVATKLSVKKICSTKWGKDARAVTAAMKRQVFEAYGLSGNDDAACVADANGRRCEIDHLVSRELGGADDVKNLWPQPYGSAPWNATRKDRVENRLHKEVCAGRLTLEQAQTEIADDYRVPYRRYFGEP